MMGSSFWIVIDLRGKHAFGGQGLEAGAGDDWSRLKQGTAGEFVLCVPKTPNPVSRG
jgi:hypothetical protein